LESLVVAESLPSAKETAMASRILRTALAAGLATIAVSSWSASWADDREKSIADLRFELSVWRKILDTRDDEWIDERAAAIRSIRRVNDPRAVPILAEMWHKENERAGSFLVRGYYIGALINIGNGPAFQKLAEIAVEDRHWANRERAASWIGEQDSRDDAIPIYARYLRSKKQFPQALTALSYSQVPTKGKRPPDRQLVAALIDHLITETPVRKRVPVGYWDGWDVITDYEKSENATAYELLKQYSGQDFGFDQKTWRVRVLNIPQRTGQNER
jgi:hypothetical protein